jgi:hypothetical protein
MLHSNRLLDAVKVGDVVFGVAGGGQKKILLVIEADAEGFVARHVTSQALVAFGRDGRSRQAPNGGSCVITSTARLPRDAYETAVGLDRKMQQARQHPDFVLSRAEVQLILHAEEFFEAHPLPDR